jgi:hypothetical protein
MGMNAKRSSDRFFKPGLESSSLSIPALMANVAERIGREIVALVMQVRVLSFALGYSGMV